MPKDKPNDNLMGSPLLSRDTTRMHSTINPDRLEQARFSEMKEEDENPLRIIIYVVIVILIGVGSAFAVRQLISKDETSDDDTTEETDTTEDISDVTVTLTPAPDATAVSQPTKAQFTDSAITSVGTNEDTASLSVSALEYKKYTTFGRLTFTITGINSVNDFPKTTLNFDSIAQKITLDFANVVTVSEDLKEDILISDLIDEVRYNQVDSQFLIFLSEDSKYRVALNNNQLFLDIKTVRQLEIDDETTTETDTEVPDTTEDITEDTDTTPTPPAGGTNYTNEYSQNEQSIVSNVTDNTIAHNKFYYGDEGPAFEFSWGITNKVGDSYIPNASAKLIDKSGVPYLEVTIQNLSQESFQTAGITGTSLSNTGIDMSGANFVRVDRVSFANGTAKYEIRLKRKADFKLISQKTLDNKDQVISVLIAD